MFSTPKQGLLERGVGRDGGTRDPHGITQFLLPMPPHGVSKEAVGKIRKIQGGSYDHHQQNSGPVDFSGFECSR